jgi:hypothetical protein
VGSGNPSRVIDQDRLYPRGDVEPRPRGGFGLSVLRLAARAMGRERKRSRTPLVRSLLSVALRRDARGLDYVHVAGFAEPVVLWWGSNGATPGHGLSSCELAVSG